MRPLRTLEFLRPTQSRGDNGSVAASYQITSFNHISQVLDGLPLPGAFFLASAVVIACSARR